MESYEDFIRTQLSRLDGKGSGHKRESPCRGSSVIRFHGLAILPPLLTAERREEMLKYRTDAQGLDNRRIKPAVGRRILHLRELLDSVQLRKAPSLREFMGDEPLAGDWERGRRETGGRASQEEQTEECDHRDPSPLSRPSDAPDEELCDPSRALTSTVRGSPTTGDLPEFHSPAAEADVSVWDAQGEGGARRTLSEFRLAVEARGDISHRSVSSGYATHDNTEVTAGHAEVIAGQTEVTEDHMKVMADQTEVTGASTEVTAFHTEVAAGDMVVMAGHPVVVGEGEGKEIKEEGAREEEGEGRVEAAPESFFLHSTLAVTQKAPGLHGDARPEVGAGGSDCGSATGGCLDLGEPEPEPPNGPYRMSLQNLLKRSQEYRQRQRQLRGARARGPSLAHSRSDKENQPGRVQLRKARDRKPDPGRFQFCATGTVHFDRPVRTTTAHDDGPKSLERRQTLLGSGETKICEEERSGASESPQGVPAAHEPADPPAQPPRAESPPPSLKAPPLCLPGLRSDRFGSAPSPQFCTSPIRGKRTGRPVRKLPVNMTFGSSSGTRGYQSRAYEGGPGAGGGTGGGAGTGGVELAQLEMNLSSLKALISDLQTTLTDTPADEGETRPPAASQKAARSERTPPCPVTSLAQRRRVPGAFRNVSGTGFRQAVVVLSDASNQDVWANQSYDVEMPSALWPPGGVGGQGSRPGGKPLTPQTGGYGLDRQSAKRRLLMNTGGHRPLSSTPKGRISVLENQQLQQTHAGQLQVLMQEQQVQLQQTHAGQLQALMQEQQVQLQELQQRLSLGAVSVLGSSPSSVVKGVVTPVPLERPLLVQPAGAPPLLQSPGSSTLPSAWRPLVAAAVKGYLTRRLLRTERLAQLLRTVKDTQQFLQALPTQTPGRGELGGRQDLLLQERVLLQLRSARYEIHDIMLGFSPAEHMQIISWDRQLLRERDMKRKESGRTQSRGRGSLSAATVKVLERKRSVGLQKRAAERQRGPVGGDCGRRELRALSGGNR